MDKKILTVYKSVTGFTREYAEMIAREVGSALMDIKEANAKNMSGFDVIVFGGRMHAGRVDGLKRAKELYGQSGSSQLIVFATGATPNEARDIVEEMWRNNLTPKELSHIPHFYLQSGLRYEKMPLADRFMMKVFCAMMKRKKDKTEYESQCERVIGSSCDISSREYILPLLACLKD